MTRARKPTGRITFVGAGVADPELLTTRAVEALRQAGSVYADDAVPQPVREFAGSVAGSAPQPLAGSGAEAAKTLLAEARTGAAVVRLVGGEVVGTEALGREVAAVARAAVPFALIPGISAAAGAAAYAGLAVGPVRTEIDLTAGTPSQSSQLDWEAFAAAPGTLQITAPVESVAAFGAALVAAGRKPDCPVAVTADVTGNRQHTVTGGLGDVELLLGGLTGTVVVTVGKAVGSRERLGWWESRPLFGWRVLVPRTKDQAGAMSERLRQYGAVPVEVPTIAVEPPRTPTQMERAVKGLVTGRFEWIVFTSTNAVKAVREKLAEVGLDARALAGVKIACVGHSTAAAVRAFGIEPELVPSGEQSSEGLLADFPDYDEVLDPINRVLLPRADIATETLAAGLVDRGWEIDDVTAYRTVRAAPPPAPIRDAIKTAGFQAVCFTSSSTVRNLVGIAGKPHARTVVAAIGPQTAATATEFGLRVDVQPEQPGAEALVDALAAFAVARAAENPADSGKPATPATPRPRRR